ncbi:redox-regulated ATPase YchF [Lujinxingia litoralis]|uniref:Ribosome-binding ATPase YchF n=1 Tax=Lujinxingia litoralis TaxID=2211119 RepID=A0A328C6P1_9DELT|nr:redox-regulated ATPase YchF [Lujinxingia litoralis]RAL22134.1 redox-regulated ATPase YchF [Lujinxingia litoralis]
MSVSAGIVGLPNVGKSTIFNALTRAEAQSANYPFCTIDPNVGIVPVPDARLKTIEKYVPANKIIPAVVEIVDIAGLVRGASQGEGLGNKFLANIREVNAILHVVRCFDDENITHVEGGVDPVRDVEIIETELILADMQTVERRLEKARRAAKANDKTERARVEVLEKVLAELNEGTSARAIELSEEELKLTRDSHLLTDKPVLYVANVSDDDLEGNNPHVGRLRELAASQGSGVVVVCGAIEAELVELEEEEQMEMLQGLGIDEPALNVLIRATYSLLGLQAFFTAGEQEIRAWTIPVGATAPQAAGVIHTDFEKRFIRAEVYTVNDLETYGDEAGIRAAGKLRLEGKEYVVADGDILHIRHNA